MKDVKEAKEEKEGGEESGDLSTHVNFRYFAHSSLTPRLPTNHNRKPHAKIGTRTIRPSKVFLHNTIESHSFFHEPFGHLA